MLAVDSIIDCMQGAISGEIEATLRNFLRSKGITKWMISADFVVTGSERVNDSLAFTIYPYDAEFKAIYHEIENACPSDIKSIRTVPKEMLDMLADSRRFHFCFVPNQGRHGVSSMKRSQASIDATIASIGEWQMSTSKDHYLKKFKALRQRASANKFNFELLNNIVLMSSISSLIAYYIAKHTRPENICWFIDRDNMMTAYQGIAIDIMYITFSALCEREKIDQTRIQMGSATDPAATNGAAMWFDSLVRLPDYIAGAMARWDFHANTIKSKHPKFLQVVEEAMAENKHIVIVGIKFSMFIVSASIVRIFKSKNPNKLAYRNRFEVEMDYIISKIGLRDRDKPASSKRMLLTGTWLNWLWSTRIVASTKT